MDGQAFTFLIAGLIGGWSLHQWLKPRQSTLDKAVKSPPLPPTDQKSQPLKKNPKKTNPKESLADPPALPEASEITAAYQRLVVTERFKSSFLARTAHELRSPINSLIGLHQLILEDLCENPQEEREFVGQAKEAALKILRLLDTLISASKVDSGREPVQLQRTNVAELLTSIQTITQLQAANHNLRYKVVLPDPDMIIFSDDKWLCPLLINLIEDAITHTHLGTLQLWAAPGEKKHTVDLCLQTDRPLETLQTSLEQPSYNTAIDITDLDQIRLSTSLTLAVAKTMIESLQGQLAIETGPDPETQSIICCTLPTTDQ